MVKKTYGAFIAARDRCTNPDHPEFRRYGARGITFGFSSVEEFIEEIGVCPSRDLSLDRIDNDRGYERGNIRWATQQQQCRNQRKTLMVEYQGRTVPVAEIADQFGLTRSFLRARLLRGLSIDDAIAIPLRRRKCPSPSSSSGPHSSP